MRIEACYFIIYYIYTVLCLLEVWLVTSPCRICSFSWLADATGSRFCWYQTGITSVTSTNLNMQYNQYNISVGQFLWLSEVLKKSRNTLYKMADPRWPLFGNHDVIPTHMISSLPIVNLKGNTLGHTSYLPGFIDITLLLSELLREGGIHPSIMPYNATETKKV